MTSWPICQLVGGMRNFAALRDTHGYCMYNKPDAGDDGRPKLNIITPASLCHYYLAVNGMQVL